MDPLSADADPRLSAALQRVRELELELAQTKLEHVEAACRNQVGFILRNCTFCCLQAWL